MMNYENVYGIGQDNMVYSLQWYCVYLMISTLLFLL